MFESNEYVISEKPFIVRRTVCWSDCDPAGVVFTGKFSSYLLGAVLLFYRRLGWEQAPDYSLERVGLPCKHFELTFHKSLPPGAIVDIRLSVSGIRNHSFDLKVIGKLPDGTISFEGCFSPICIDPKSWTAMPIPSALIEVLSGFRE